MLGLLGKDVAERKLRLFLLACCRDLWGASPEEAVRVALDVTERLAETGQLRRAEEVVRVPAGAAVIDCGASEPVRSLWTVRADGSPATAHVPPSGPGLTPILEHLACSRVSARFFSWMSDLLDRWGLPLARQAELLRDLVRGPFRPLVVRAAWRTHAGGTVANLARVVADGRSFDALPVLADALEDAGCAEAELLGHLRGPGPHVRGCWALDAVLGLP
jgi:hypothetical protein